MHRHNFGVIAALSSAFGAFGPAIPIHNFNLEPLPNIVMDSGNGKYPNHYRGGSWSPRRPQITIAQRRRKRKLQRMARKINR